MGPTPALPGDFPDVAGIRTLATEQGWRLVVLFGSAARGEPARDLDLAVLPATDAGAPGVDLLTHGRWQAELEAACAPRPVDLVLLTPGLSPVTRYQIFRDGVCLLEAEPGLFSREQDRAFFLHADSEHFRRQQSEALHGGA